MNTIKQLLNSLIECAELLGLNGEDIKNAQEYLEHREYGLCSDTLITQICEYDMEITEKFYSMVEIIGAKMNLPTETYYYMKEQIRSEGNIPKSVKEKLAGIVNSIR